MLIPLVALSILISILYAHQDEVVNELVDTLNEDFVGEIKIEGSHISPFANFPYISIDLEGVKIFPDKKDHTEAILHLEDAYVGFDLLTIIQGKYDIKSLKLKGGFIHKPMFERLILCEYAVADLTTANANVFYELGIRHAVRSWSTVMVFAEGVSQLPFDVAPVRALPYKLDNYGNPINIEETKAALTCPLFFCCARFAT